MHSSIQRTMQEMQERQRRPGRGIARAPLVAAAVAIVACAAVRPAAAQGFDERFPDPISTEELVQSLAPLLVGNPQAWPSILRAHSTYLAAQRSIRDVEVEPWILSAERRGAGPDLDPSLEARIEAGREETSEARALERGRLRLRGALAELDDHLFESIVAAAGPDIAPSIEWLHVRRTLATCECDLDVQTADVSFSLLSYGDVALEPPSVVWAAPESAGPLVDYERRILRSGRAYLAARRAAERRAGDDAGDRSSAPDASPEPGDATLRGDDAGDEGRGADPSNRAVDEAANAPPDSNAAGDTIDSDDGADEPESANERAARERAGRLARMGRRMVPAIESALPARARLLFRIRLMLRTAALEIPEESRRGDAGPRQPPLRETLGAIGTLLGRAIDPATRDAIDIAAVEAIAADHWAVAAPLADQILQIIRRRSNVLFDTGARVEPPAAAQEERRRIELVQQWRPLAAQALDSLRAVVKPPEAAPPETLAPDEMFTGTIRLGTGSVIVPDLGAATPAPRGALEGLREVTVAEVIDSAPLANFVPEPLGVARIAEALGMEGRLAEPAVHDFLAIVGALRADALLAARDEIAGLARRIAATGGGDGEPPAIERAALEVRMRDSVRQVDQRIVAGIEPLLDDEEERLRLRLIELSAALSIAHGAFDANHVFGMSWTVLLSPLDPAKALLEHGFVRGRRTSAGEQDLAPGDRADRIDHDQAATTAADASAGTSIERPRRSALADPSVRAAAEVLLARGDELVSAAVETDAALAAGSEVAIRWIRAMRRDGRPDDGDEMDGPHAFWRDPAMRDAAERGAAAVRRQFDLEHRTLDAMAAVCDPATAAALRRDRRGTRPCSRNRSRSPARAIASRRSPAASAQTTER
ncbi:MAG: hypothetical protein U0575_14370 [Phycisphaerales bacterium]